MGKLSQCVTDTEVDSAFYPSVGQESEYQLSRCLIIINGDGGYIHMVYWLPIGRPVAQSGSFGPKVGSHLAPCCIHRMN